MKKLKNIFIIALVITNVISFLGCNSKSDTPITNIKPNSEDQGQNYQAGNQNPSTNIKDGNEVVDIDKENNVTEEQKNKLNQTNKGKNISKPNDGESGKINNGSRKNDDDDDNDDDNDDDDNDDNDDSENNRGDGKENSGKKPDCCNLFHSGKFEKEITLKINGKNVTYNKYKVNHDGNCYFYSLLPVMLSAKTKDLVKMFDNIKTELVEDPFAIKIRKKRLPKFAAAFQTNDNDANNTYEKLFNDAKKVVLDIKSGKERQLENSEITTLARFLKDTALLNKLLKNIRFQELNTLSEIILKEIHKINDYVPNNVEKQYKKQIETFEYQATVDTHWRILGNLVPATKKEMEEQFIIEIDKALNNLLKNTSNDEDINNFASSLKKYYKRIFKSKSKISEDKKLEETEKIIEKKTLGNPRKNWWGNGNEDSPYFNSAKVIYDAARGGKSDKVSFFYRTTPKKDEPNVIVLHHDSAYFDYLVRLNKEN